MNYPIKTGNETHQRFSDDNFYLMKISSNYARTYWNIISGTDEIFGVYHAQKNLSHSHTRSRIHFIFVLQMSSEFFFVPHSLWIHEKYHSELFILFENAFAACSAYEFNQWKICWKFNWLTIDTGNVEQNGTEPKSEEGSMEISQKKNAYLNHMKAGHVSWVLHRYLFIDCVDRKYYVSDGDLLCYFVTISLWDSRLTYVILPPTKNALNFSAEQKSSNFSWENKWPKSMPEEEEEEMCAMVWLIRQFFDTFWLENYWFSAE